MLIMTRGTGVTARESLLQGVMMKGVPYQPRGDGEGAMYQISVSLMKGLNRSADHERSMQQRLGAYITRYRDPKTHQYNISFNEILLQLRSTEQTRYTAQTTPTMKSFNIAAGFALLAATCAFASDTEFEFYPGKPVP